MREENVVLVLVHAYSGPFIRRRDHQVNERDTAPNLAQSHIFYEQGNGQSYRPTVISHY